MPQNQMIMSSSRTIPQIEADIQAIKDANPAWVSNPIVMAFITALAVEKNGIKAWEDIASQEIERENEREHELKLKAIEQGKSRSYSCLTFLLIFFRQANRF